MASASERRARVGRRAFTAGTGVVLWQALELGLGAGLSGCEASTGGARVRLASRVTSDVAESRAFVSELGWRLELTRAFLSLGALYYVEGPPLGNLGATWRSSAFRSAQAHPGHYAAGSVLGEVIEPAPVDLLAGERVLAASEGFSGVARSAIVAFAEPPAGDVVTVEGLAERDGMQRRFRAGASLEQLKHSGSGQPEVPGCPLDDGEIDGDGTITLAVQTALWLAQVDFSLVPEAMGSEPVDLEPALPPHNAFLRGLKKALAYRFRYRPGLAAA